MWKWQINFPPNRIPLYPKQRKSTQQEILFHPFNRPEVFSHVESIRLSTQRCRWSVQCTWTHKGERSEAAIAVEGFGYFMQINGSFIINCHCIQFTKIVFIGFHTKELGPFETSKNKFNFMIWTLFCIRAQTVICVLHLIKKRDFAYVEISHYASFF